MRRLNHPPHNSRSTIDRCIESIQSRDLKERLTLVVDAIEEAEAAYIRNGETQTLYSIPQTLDVAGEVSVAEMRRVYKDTFVKSVRTRDIYDQIKKLPPNDICPLCGQRTVSTLDHYLPQSLHAALAVTPINLVPACIDCNKAKLDAQPGAQVEQTFHPYFDDLDDGVWLNAFVQERIPAALRFYPDPPEAWPDLKKHRLFTHFRTFALGPLYASHSAAELTNIRYGLQRIAERGTPEDIRDELVRRKESSEAAHRNSWQTAMYRALSRSEWFCGGGFEDQ